MTDYINRQAAIDAIRENVWDKLIVNDIFDVLKDLPAAPVREAKRGNWIYKGLYKCSVCGDVLCCAGNFCPTCGAAMRKGDEYGDL